MLNQKLNYIQLSQSQPQSIVNPDLLQQLNFKTISKTPSYHYISIYGKTFIDNQPINDYITIDSNYLDTITLDTLIKDITSLESKLLFSFTHFYVAKIINQQSIEFVTFNDSNNIIYTY